MSEHSTGPIWRLAVLWSAALLLTTFATLALAGVLLFGFSLVLGTPMLPLAFRLGLFVQPVVWSVGIAVSWRVHRSRTLAGTLAVIGAAVFFALPVLIYFLVLLTAGGWQMR